MCRYTACRRHQRDEIKGDAARPSEPRAAAAAAARSQAEMKALRIVCRASGAGRPGGELTQSGRYEAGSRTLRAVGGSVLWAGRLVALKAERFLVRPTVRMFCSPAV